MRGDGYRGTTVRALRIGLLAGALAALAPAAFSPAARAQGLWQESGPYTARVTTDSLEYCTHLLNRIDAMRPRVEEPSRRADLLTAQGREMCATGHVRPGIARLRRALLLLEDAR